MPRCRVSGSTGRRGDDQGADNVCGEGVHVGPRTCRTQQLLEHRLIGDVQPSGRGQLEQFHDGHSLFVDAGLPQAIDGDDEVLVVEATVLVPGHSNDPASGRHADTEEDEVTLEIGPFLLRSMWISTGLSSDSMRPTNATGSPTGGSFAHPRR